MAKRTSPYTRTNENAGGTGSAATEQVPYRYCAVPQVPERLFNYDMNPHRARLIQIYSKKWVNGTVLHYYFFDQETDGQYLFGSAGRRVWQPWTTTEAEKNVVRRAFQQWKDVGIGLQFEEVTSRTEAEIRIGFMRGDGAWSYVGRDMIDLNIAHDARTMNFGWDLTEDEYGFDTALHEIGHAMGLEHEHQNPFAGIVWNEEEVYRSLAGPPNYWDPETIYNNIIRKITPDDGRGSSWDPDSIMHYPFPPGLILQPTEYRGGLLPEGGLSDTDIAWIRQLYPPLEAEEPGEGEGEEPGTGGGEAPPAEVYPTLVPFESSKLSLAPGEQRNYIIRPDSSRYYEIRTFGVSDTVMVLFEEDPDGTLRYISGDDDSGDDRNAYIRYRLLSGRRYVLRIRLYWADRAGDTTVMLW